MPYLKLSKNNLTLPTLSVAVIAASLAACTPTVKVEAPDKPIVINMNINISHEVRVKIDRDLDNVLDKKSNIF